MSKHAKIIGKEFGRSIGRFIAVLAIIALGVGFLIGIMDSTPDMKRTMDHLYDTAHTYDVQVKSTFGLYPDDVAAIAGAESVLEAYPANVLDAAVSSARYKEAVGRITGVDFENQKINALTLIEGEFPTAPGECVVERSNTYLQSYAPGDVIRVADGSDREKFKIFEFKVTGIVSGTLYYAKSEKERSAAGNGRLGAVLYIAPSDFNMTVTQDVVDMLGGADEVSFSVGDPIYTDCFVTVKDALAAEAFSDGYERLISDGADVLDTLGTSRSAALVSKIDAFNADAKLKAEERLSAIQSMIDPIRSALDALDEFVAGGGVLDAAQEAQKQELLRQRQVLLDKKAEIETGIAKLYTDTAGIKWYALDRTMNTSYASMAINIDKVKAIAGIFPVFFILVAALVALTTMTKMVEEDRAQIGMLKALGYSKARILSKYLLYCGLATLLGCGIGVTCGFAVLPTILWQAYTTLYMLPPLLIRFNWLFSTLLTIGAVSATALVTIVACLNSMRERPATLMLPKAPKAGKRILLERVGFIWKPLPFKFKAMVRNIFRYKKNMWMTIVGIAGCTALIVTGFGIQDSVRAISDRQFGEINRYDMTVSVTGEAAGYDADLKTFLQSKSYTAVREETANLLVADGKKESVTIYAGGTGLSDFVKLCPRGKKMPLAFDGESVILSENLAKEYKIKVGSPVTMEIGGVEKGFTVSGITENYVGCYCYMGRAAFEEAFSLSGDNLLLLRAGVPAESEDGVTRTLLSCAAVTGIEFVSQTRVSYDNLLSTMKLITLVLIVCAGCLSVIVLYNLTNINIDERKKELATLKVLGYRPIEVAGYVYREAFVLSVVGMLVGLGIGALLHLFVIAQVETVTMMLGRGVHALSFLFSAIITLVFSGVVDLMLAPKLAKIKMADSMKAND